MNFRSIVAVYLFIGAMLCFILFIISMSLGAFLNYLFPALFIVLLYLFVVFSTIFFLLKPKRSRRILVDICLAIQTIYFFAFGISYKNYFGPFVGIELNSTNVMSLNLEAYLLNFQNAMGYSGGKEDFVIGLNLVPLIILIVLSVLEKRAHDRGSI